MKNYITKDGVSDAGLLRAARDMYDALEDLAHVVEEIDIYGYAPGSRDTLDRAYAALAKANGEI